MIKIDPLLAFFSGIGVSLISAVVAHILTRRRERRRLVEELRFKIYMKLMDLHGSYFWFTVAELHKEVVPVETRNRCRDLAWQIADILRFADEVDSLEEILETTHSPKFASAEARYEAMGRVLDYLGTKINPRYSKKIREISKENIRLLASGGSSNAPGATSGYRS
jgi:hypothetical protein